VADRILAAWRCRVRRTAGLSAGDRWVIVAFGLIGLLATYLPAYTDRKGFWTLDGNTIPWIGVVLFATGGALRIKLRAIFDGLYELAGNPTKPVTADDIAQTRRNIRELTKVGEREIHEMVLSCTRARRQLLSSVPTAKPTLH
jgi:hypothetical protein